MAARYLITLVHEVLNRTRTDEYVLPSTLLVVYVCGLLSRSSASSKRLWRPVAVADSQCHFLPSACFQVSALCSAHGRARQSLKARLVHRSLQ